MERFNEFLIQFCTVCLFFFSDYIPSPETQYTYGMVIIAAMAILMLSNLFMVFKVAASTLALVAKKYYIRLANWISPKEVVGPENEPIAFTPSKILEKYIKL